MLKQVYITRIDNSSNIICFDNDYRQLRINANITDDIIIFDLEHLKRLLSSLFVEQKSIKLLDYDASNKSVVQYLDTIIEIKLYDLFASKLLFD